MIIGTGIDIIEVHRVAEKVDRSNGFREKVFSNNEIQYCESGSERAQRYAARFAVKEAFLKATGGGLTLGHELYEIEVHHAEEGKPYIVLQGRFKMLAGEHGWNRIHVSLSHVPGMACAVVIIEQ